MKKYGRVRSVSLAMVVVFLLAACGSDGGSESPTPTQAVVTTTTLTSSPSSTSEPGGSGGIGGVSQACLEAAQAYASAFGGYATVMGGMTPEQARQIADQLEVSVGAVPDDLRDDYADVAEMLGIFYQGVADMGLQPGTPMTPGQLEEFAELAKKLDEGGYQEAAERVGNWFSDNCS